MKMQLGCCCDSPSSGSSAGSGSGGGGGIETVPASTCTNHALWSPVAKRFQLSWPSDPGGTGACCAYYKGPWTLHFQSNSGISCTWCSVAVLRDLSDCSDGIGGTGPNCNASLAWLVVQGNNSGNDYRCDAVIEWRHSFGQQRQFYTLLSGFDPMGANTLPQAFPGTLRPCNVPAPVSCRVEAVA